MKLICCILVVFSWLGESSRSTSLELARMARSRGIPTSFDVNIRPNLWVGRMDELVSCMERMLKHADIVKLGRGR